MLKKTFALTVFCILGNTLFVQAQNMAPEVLATSGGHGSSATYQVSWTIGEPIIETYSNSSNQLTQGFHQTSLNITSISKLENTIEITAYPNPTTSYLNISIDNKYLVENLQLNLFNTLGKSLLQKRLNVNSDTHQINLESYPSGVYFVTVQKDTQVLNTYQVIKK